MALKDWKKVGKDDYQHKDKKLDWVSIEKDDFTGNQYVLSTPDGYENGSLIYLRKQAKQYMENN